MKIELKNRLSADSAADEHDVRQVKKALNMLGYYTPFEQTGITGTPDARLFSALKKFQKDSGLPASGVIKPEDVTIETLNDALTNTPEGYYIWRTAGDERVRPEHAQYNGTKRAWSDSPDPGEDFNCRCWAEPIPVGLEQKLITEIHDSKRWADIEFLMHFAFGSGKTVTLEEIGYLSAIITKAEGMIFPNIEDQVAEKMLTLKSSQITYTTEASYPFSDVHPYFGGGTVRTKTEGKVIKEKDLLSIRAIVQYEYEDTFTDPRNIRQNKYGTSSPDGISRWEIFITDHGGSYYKIIGKWLTLLTGSIKIE